MNEFFKMEVVVVGGGRSVDGGGGGIVGGGVVVEGVGVVVGTLVVGTLVVGTLVVGTLVVVGVGATENDVCATVGSTVVIPVAGDSVVSRFVVVGAVLVVLMCGLWVVNHQLRRFGARVEPPW